MIRVLLMIKTRNKSHRGNGALRNSPSVFADGNITSDIGDVQYTEDCNRNASGVIRVSKSSIGSFYSMICVEKNLPRHWREHNQWSVTCFNMKAPRYILMSLVPTIKEHGFSGVSLFRFRLRADLLIGISDWGKI